MIHTFDAVPIAMSLNNHDLSRTLRRADGVLIIYASCCSRRRCSRLTSSPLCFSLLGVGWIWLCPFCGSIRHYWTIILSRSSRLSAENTLALLGWFATTVTSSWRRRLPLYIYSLFALGFIEERKKKQKKHEYTLIQLSWLEKGVLRGLCETPRPPISQL